MSLCYTHLHIVTHKVVVPTFILVDLLTGLFLIRGRKGKVAVMKEEKYNETLLVIIILLLVIILKLI